MDTMNNIMMLSIFHMNIIDIDGSKYVLNLLINYNANWCKLSQIN